ncbi:MULTISPECIES: enoyl-CoA hydratase [Bacillus]|jgi:enoyl-CoA hydratase/carnithine racemase|uniref:enoyl-CoA hydratase n=1 Tax=Bacillus TaxID=1386 RepID=UPI00065DE8DB|nr:enoyl-CoA hydratase [Bacillus smithii]AKP48349.1 Methylglutaconyl-CoA hydratase [Bacillus smithii]MED4885215.1 enoyl-CoA hydratase [Bacillus smithii]MED4927890.1 enoyl-CoA hydratase [Bacillus smithii]
MGEMVRWEHREKIAIIILNRPEAANALSKQLLSELKQLLQTIKGQSDIQTVIITGSGPFFCAGADLKERKGMDEEEVKQAVQQIRSIINEVENVPQPTIAAINGAAMGGGLELALACDIRIAAQDAKLGLTETSLGIIPGAGGTQRLPRLIGKGRAKELIFAARKISGAEAETLGLVEYAVEAERVLEKAFELAKEFVENAPLSLRQAKIAVNKGMETDIMTGLKIEELAYNALLNSSDRIEGLKAFQEKRQPRYTGR